MELTVKQLTKSYNKIEVLNIHFLSIPKGEAFGLVGNNGAGKTTLIRLILDLIKADSGETMLDEVRVDKHESWKRYTASYVDESFLIPFLTPQEYFALIADVYKIDNTTLSARLDQYAEFISNGILKDNKLIRNYSQGNQRKIGIIAALIVNPKLLVLDEPFANLDPTSQLRLVKLLNKIKLDGNPTMFISSHNLEHIMNVCERIAIIEEGEIVEDLYVTSEGIEKIKGYFSV